MRWQLILAGIIFFVSQPVSAGDYALPIIDVDYNCLHEKDNTEYPEDVKISISRTCVRTNREAYSILKSGQWAEISDISQTICLYREKTDAYYYYNLLECTRMMRTNELNNEELRRRSKSKDTE